MNRDILWLWYTEKKTITKKIKYNLFKYFGNIEDIYNASRNDYKNVGFLSDKDIDCLCDKDLKDYELISELYAKNNVKLVSIEMDEYPSLLKHLSTPPLLLYCRGKFINLNERFCISVVGTRKITDYGKNCTRNITKELAESGAVIVSGMAVGVDSCAHWAALEAGMPTVAVVGTGVNMVYPKSNSRLMKEIIKTGMVISEYPLNSVPEKFHFPERNRIISGLSAATLVVEADIKSGSLITANYSLELGRDVFAVPGSIYSIYSKGTNYLIKDGAYVATCAEDIISPYREKYGDLIINGMNDINQHNNIEETSITKTPETPKKAEIDENMDDENKILSVLSEESISIDDIFEKTGIPVSVLNQKLLLMELAGQIKKHPGNNYSK